MRFETIMLDPQQTLDLATLDRAAIAHRVERVRRDFHE
jgi:hypothetical protein